MPLDVLAASQAMTKGGRRRSSQYNRFVPDEDGEEMEKFKNKPQEKAEYGSFDQAEADPGTQHVPGNPFVKVSIF